MGAWLIEWSSLLLSSPVSLAWTESGVQNGFGITVSYWTTEEAITGWKAHLQHKPAQETGKRVWYADYYMTVARVERAYGKIYPEGEGQQTIHSNEAD
jgi:hypothetical protein